MKNKFLVLASILILPHALAESFQEVNLGTAKCVQVKQNFENGEPKGPPITKNFNGPVLLHINGSAVAVSAGAGGPNGFVNSLNFAGEGSNRGLSGSSSNHQTLASSGFGQLMNDFFDKPNEDKRTRFLKIGKRKLTYDLHVRLTNGGGNDGYLLSNKCDFPSDIQLSEIHGIYAAAKTAAHVQSDRGADDNDSGGGTGGSSSSSAGTR